MDNLAFSIIYMYDVDITQNIILKIFWFHTPASHFTKQTWHHGRYFQAKNGNDRLIPHFWWHFFAHPWPEILTKHNTKETSSKGNIWGPFYITGGQRQRRTWSRSRIRIWAEWSLVERSGVGRKSEPPRMTMGWKRWREEGENKVAN